MIRLRFAIYRNRNRICLLIIERADSIRKHAVHELIKLLVLKINK